jgi:hypothetical protein
VRRALKGAVVLLFAAVSCRQVDPSGGAIDRAFGGAPRDAVPPGVDETYDAFVAACADHDASTAWTTMSRDLQERIDEEAREQATTAGLRERFGYRGHEAGFDGTAYLQALLRAGAPGSPCPDADFWRRVDAGPDGDTFIVVSERPDGLRQAVRFVASEGEAWRVDAISSPRDPRSQ